MNKICVEMICAGLMASGVCLCSCESLEDTWAEYLEGGEIVYAPLADTLYCYSGRNRVALNYVITKSPNLKEMCVEWMPAAEGFLYNEVRYRNNNGEEITVISEKEDVAKALPGIRSGTVVDVYVGDDGNDWTLIARTSPVATDDMQWFEVAGSMVERQVKGRFLKIVVTHTYDNDDGITGLAEVDVRYVKAVDGVPLNNE